ncbi:MAG: hypothetical protein IPK50_01035 [Fibrobacterota bacterium]|nr:hypothetical protein [Fibrobacterota bacterium]QQS05497.1 MAG: hypothetical protein IPK50_01035 [Fibrobacterota bacterium]
MEHIATKIRELRKTGQDPLLGLSIVYSISADYYYADVQETRDILTIEGNGTVTRLSTNDQRNPENPPGKWSGTIARADLEAFVKRLEAGGIDLPSGGRGSPMVSEPYEVLHVKIAGVEGEVGRRGVQMRPKPCGFDDLRPFLNRWAEACKKPLWKLSLEAIDPKVEGKRIHATLRFSNHGTQAIKIPHPASPTKDDAIRLAFFHYLPQVTEPGFTPLPLEITEATLDLPKTNQVEWITIGPDGWWDLVISQEVSGPPGPKSEVFFQFRTHLPISNGKPESFQGTVTSVALKL